EWSARKRAADEGERMSARPLRFQALKQRPARNPQPAIPFESNKTVPFAGGNESMGFFTKDIKTMNDLFMHGLQDLYYAENQIAKSLPDMIEKATNPQLRAGFEKHLSETEGQIARLAQVFELLDAEAKGERCPAIDGIL